MRKEGKRREETEKWKISGTYRSRRKNKRAKVVEGSLGKKNRVKISWKTEREPYFGNRRRVCT